MLRTPITVIAIGGASLIATHAEPRVTAPDGRAQADRVNIHIDTEAPGWTISKYLTGMHMVYGSEPDRFWDDPRVANWMKKANVGTIRYPGGTAVQTWHWDAPNGINFHTDTWTPGAKTEVRPAEQWTSLAEYIALCRKIDAEPMIGINTRSGKKFNRKHESIESARKLVQHCKERGYGVKLWYIGNESYIGWGAKGYARAIDAYAAAMKSVDPDLTIIGDWKFGPEEKHRFQQTIEVCKLSKHLDVMEVHEKYLIAPKEKGFGLMASGYTSTSVEGWQRENGIYDGRLQFYIKKFYSEMEAAGLDTKLAFNEWTAMGRDPYTSSLVKADYLITLFNHATFSACDWSVHWKDGPLVMNKKTGEMRGFRPAADIYALLSHALEKRHLPMTSDGGNVYGFATTADAEGAFQIYLLNKRSREVVVNLTTTGELSPPHKLDVESLTRKGMISPPQQVWEGGAGTKVKIPPLSFNRILGHRSSTSEERR